MRSVSTIAEQPQPPAARQRAVSKIALRASLRNFFWVSALICNNSLLSRRRRTYAQCQDPLQQPQTPMSRSAIMSALGRQNGARARRSAPIESAGSIPKNNLRPVRSVGKFSGEPIGVADCCGPQPFPGHRWASLREMVRFCELLVGFQVKNHRKSLIYQICD